MGGKEGGVRGGDAACPAGRLSVSLAASSCESSGKRVSLLRWLPSSGAAAAARPQQRGVRGKAEKRRSSSSC